MMKLSWIFNFRTLSIDWTGKIVIDNKSRGLMGAWIYKVVWSISSRPANIHRTPSIAESSESLDVPEPTGNELVGYH